MLYKPATTSLHCTYLMTGHRQDSVVQVNLVSLSKDEGRWTVARDTFFRVGCYTC